jgi:hypothetical protein
MFPAQLVGVELIENGQTALIVMGMTQEDPALSYLTGYNPLVIFDDLSCTESPVAASKSSAGASASSIIIYAGAGAGFVVLVLAVVFIRRRQPHGIGTDKMIEIQLIGGEGFPLSSEASYSSIHFKSISSDRTRSSNWHSSAVMGSTVTWENDDSEAKGSLELCDDKGLVLVEVWEKDRVTSESQVLIATGEIPLIRDGCKMNRRKRLTCHFKAVEENVSRDGGSVDFYVTLREKDTGPKEASRPKGPLGELSIGIMYVTGSKLSDLHKVSIKSKFGRGVHVTREVSAASLSDNSLGWNENFTLMLTEIEDDLHFTVQNVDSQQQTDVVKEITVPLAQIFDLYTLSHLHPEERCESVHVMPEGDDMQLCFKVGANFSSDWPIRKLRHLAKERGHGASHVKSTEEEEALALLNRGLQQGGNYRIMPKQFQAGLADIDVEFPPEPAVGLLMVRLKRASNLIRTGEAPFNADPYVVFTIGGETWKSRMFTNDLNPVWNETFHLVTTELSDDLEFNVMDFDEDNAHTFMGSGKVPIGQLAHDQEYAVDVPLQGVDHGEIFVDVLLKVTNEDLVINHQKIMRRDRRSVVNLLKVAHSAPAGYVKPPSFPDQQVYDEDSPPSFEELQSAKKAEAVLHITLLSGYDLVAMEEFPMSSDPYVLFGLGVHGHAYRSSVKKNNLNPEWNESFDLIVGDLSENLHIYVMDEDADKPSGEPDDGLGNSEFPLWRLHGGHEKEELLRLEGVASGHVRLRMKLDVIPGNEAKLDIIRDKAQVKSQTRDRNVMWSATALPGYCDPPSFEDDFEDGGRVSVDMSAIMSKKTRNASVVLGGISPGNNTTNVDQGIVVNLDHFSPNTDTTLLDNPPASTNMDDVLSGKWTMERSKEGKRAFPGFNTMEAPNPAYGQDFGEMNLSDFSVEKKRYSFSPGFGSDGPGIYAGLGDDIFGFGDLEASTPRVTFQTSEEGAYEGEGTKDGFQTDDLTMGFEKSEEGRYENTEQPRKGFRLDDAGTIRRGQDEGAIVSANRPLTTDMAKQGLLRVASRKTTSPDGTVTEEIVTVRDDSAKVEDADYRPKELEAPTATSIWQNVYGGGDKGQMEEGKPANSVWGNLDFLEDDGEEENVYNTDLHDLDGESDVGSINSSEGYAALGFL